MLLISSENGILWSLAVFIAGLAITFIVAYYLDKILMKSLGQVAFSQPKLLTMTTIMRRMAVLSVALVGVMASTFTAFPESMGVITSIFIAAGFASIVIGMAAQSSFSNVISGIINSISQPFRISDAVMFRDEFCYIEDMRLIHTIMRTWDNRRLVVPNSILQNEVIINYSMSDPSVLVPINIRVSYESDLSKAMQIMTDIARNHPECQPIGDIPNAVVMEFQDSGVLLRLLSRAKDQSIAFSMARDILLSIKMEFDAQNIEIPYPKRQLVLGRELQDRLIEFKCRDPNSSMN
jgi:small-conductance mechanosensitive channel